MLQALEKNRKTARIVRANQASEPQIVFLWASISPSAVVRVTQGKVKAMVGWPAHYLTNPTKPCKALSGTRVSFKLLAYPRQLAIGLGSTLMWPLKSYDVHDYLPKDKQSYQGKHSPSTDANGPQGDVLPFSDRLMVLFLYVHSKFFSPL